MISTTTRKLRVGPVRAHRDAAFYDRMVRERSPYTGVIEPPLSNASNEALHVSPPLRRAHLVALGLIAMASTAAFVSLKGQGTAMAAAVVPAALPAPAKVVDIERGDAKEEEALPRLIADPEAVAVPEAAPIAVPAVKPEEPSPVAPKDAVSYEEMLESSTKGPFKKRVESLREALAAYPDRDEAMARLSILLMEKAPHRGEALDLATRAVSINEKNAMAWLAIGYLKQLSGQNVDARQAYARCADGVGPTRYLKECKSLI